MYVGMYKVYIRMCIYVSYVSMYVGGMHVYDIHTYCYLVRPYCTCVVLSGLLQFEFDVLRNICLVFLFLALLLNKIPHFPLNNNDVFQSTYE